jgi:hypothetical protein
MTDEQKPTTGKLENLELNKETVQDLNDSEAEQGKGGVFIHDCDTSEGIYRQLVK